VPYTSRVGLELDAKAPPTGWELINRSPQTTRLQLLFAVKQSNLPHLEKTLLEVSDPDSKFYGQYLTNDEVHSLIAPDSSSIQEVKEFLASHGLVGVAHTPNSDFIEVHVTVAQAEKMLNCEYFFMKHSSGKAVHRTLGYSLPPSVRAAVDFVAPTVHLPPPHNILLPSIQEPNALFNSPNHLRQLYSVDDTVGQAPNNKMAVTAFLGQHYHRADLYEFQKLFCGGITCGKGDPITVGDGVEGPTSGVEAMLDIETINGVAGNITSEFWGFGGNDPDAPNNENFFKWLAAVSNTSDADVPKLFSTSYGEDEDSWSNDAAVRMNTEFQKAGARGITLLFAAGDEGANCKGGKYVSETPGSSPWVTAVGGTTGLTTESAAGLSSGGFSSRWAMPDYQVDAVNTYMTTAKNLPDKKFGYNTTMRAYPDISAQATDFTVVSNLIPLPGVAGTSCATPTAAGVIALLNDARMQAGKPTLGFLNPWIYKNSGQWNDIVTGQSGGCGSDGWPAASGWDAVTGVGTPNYKNLVNLL